MEKLFVCDSLTSINEIMEKSLLAHNRENAKAVNDDCLTIKFGNCFFPDNIDNTVGSEKLDLFNAIRLILSRPSSLGRVYDSSCLCFYFIGCKFDKLTVVPMVRSFVFYFEDCEIDQLDVELLMFDNQLHFCGGFIKKLDFLRGRIDLKPFNAPMTFESVEIHTVYSNNCQFMGPIQYLNCIFGEGSTSALSFSDTQFKNRIYFGGSIFKVAPWFFNCDIHADNDLTTCVFLDTTSSGASRAYGALRHKMMDLEADYAIQFFHSLELESRYKTELPPLSQVFKHPAGVEKIASLFLFMVNQYGRNLWLPLCWLLVLAILSCGVYVSANGFYCAEELPNWLSGGCAPESNVLDVFMSVRNMMGPFGLALNAESVAPNTLFIKSVSFLQLMLSSLIWFIWILQIRSKFKI